MPVAVLSPHLKRTTDPFRRHFGVNAGYTMWGCTPWWGGMREVSGPLGKVCKTSARLDWRGA